MTGSPVDARPRLLFVAPNPSVDRLVEVDAVTVGTIHRPAFALAVPGGKGLNAARAAVALGARATVVAIVGGRSGDWIAERLAELGVDASLVRDATGGETRTCLSVLDRSTGRLTEFYESGVAVGPATWTAFEDAVAAELAPGDVSAVVCSGSLPPGSPADGYARIVRLGARDRHGRRHARRAARARRRGAPIDRQGQRRRGGRGDGAPGDRAGRGGPGRARPDRTRCRPGSS